METPVGSPSGEQKVFVRSLREKNQRDVEWKRSADQWESLMVSIGIGADGLF